MRVRIYTDPTGQPDKPKYLYDGPVDMIHDMDHQIIYISPWPKKFEVYPMQPMLNVKCEPGTTAKVLETEKPDEDPSIILRKGENQL